MWLLKIEDVADNVPTIKLEYHVGTYPKYVILSHRWGSPSDEVSFQGLQNHPMTARMKAGYRKVEQCCIKASERGLQYAWIDTCCIDKSSSVELSEAINSMYAWYRDAEMCFAYLEDVSVPASDPTFRQQFKHSSWFTRGWTLQELLAPSRVIFFTSDWCHTPIGHKGSLAILIHDITSIPVQFLADIGNPISQASVAEKMSWASKRVTTRIEDEAYCLMGLFGVHIPIIYGEGRHAFQRLQEEIMKTTPDHSIFAWSHLPTNFGDHFPVLAERPAQFLESSDYVPMDLGNFDTRHGPGEPGYTMTNFGLRIDLPIFSFPKEFGGLFVAFIACEFGRRKNTCKEVGLILRQRSDRPNGHFFRVVLNNRPLLLFSRNNAFFASRMRTRRGVIWLAARLESTTRVVLDSPSRFWDRVTFRGVSVNGDIPPLMNHATELMPGKYVAVVAAFKGGSDYHPGHMHLLLAALGLHDGKIWCYIDEKEAAIDGMGATERLYRNMELFVHGMAGYSPEVRDKIKFFQRGHRAEHVTWNSWPCNSLIVHMKDLLGEESVFIEVDGVPSAQWVQLKISGQALRRHNFGLN